MCTNVSPNLVAHRISAPPRCSLTVLFAHPAHPIAYSCIKCMWVYMRHQPRHAQRRSVFTSSSYPCDCIFVSWFQSAWGFPEGVVADCMLNGTFPNDRSGDGVEVGDLPGRDSNNAALGKSGARAVQIKAREAVGGREVGSRK